MGVNKSDGLSKKIDVVSFCRENEWKQKVSDVFADVISWHQYYKWCSDTFNTITFKEKKEFREYNGY